VEEFPLTLTATMEKPALYGNRLLSRD